MLDCLRENMTSRPSLTEEDFSCPVCCDIFREPILLACSHSICKRCLNSFWDQRKAQECPICRTVSQSPHPPVNIVLRDMCEAVVKEKTRRLSVELGGICSLHRQAFTLFCLKEQRPLCDKCRGTKVHSKNTVCSIRDASQDLKQELQKKLKPLREKLNLYEDFKQSCITTEQHIKEQASVTKALIKKEFEKLHQFLWDEEAARIAALFEEEEDRSKAIKTKIENITTQISSILYTVKAIEKEIEEEDLPFLLNYNKSSDEKIQSQPDNPEKLSAVLINVAQHVGNLGFQVSEKMRGIVQYTPVVLDPNTANGELVVSDNLITVVYTGEHRQLPLNSERFEGYASVLGSEGFNSGTHYWDVEVGNNTAWAVGVIAESVCLHREKLSQFGLWYVGFNNGKYARGYSREILSLLRVSERIRRIRVQLDCVKGRVTFIDLDRNTCLHIFKQAFNERVLPYFYSHCKLHPLRILPGNPH